jgi:PEGA domain.
MRAIRLLLSLILLLALASTAQAVVTLNIYVEDSEGLRIPDAAVYIDDSYIGSTSSTGYLSYTHPGTENFILRVTKSGYESRSVNVQRSETTRTITLTRSSAVLTVLVYDENVAPLKNAIVRVVGPSSEKTEETGSNGKAVFSLSDGETYQIRITALDYRDAETSVQLSGASREVSVVMERGDRFAFRITDEETKKPIQGAEITVDGIVRGTTRDDGIFSYNLRKGYEYQITVKKPEYHPYSVRQYISGDQQVLSIALSKDYYSPFVSVFDPDKKVVEGADVYLDGTLLRKTDGYGRASLGSLTAGTYLLEIRKSGFEPYSREITISDGSIDFAVDLSYSSVPVRVLVADASHSVISGATISAGGVIKGTTDGSGILFINLQPGSEYVLSAAKDGYHEGSVRLVVPVDGQQESVTITLESQISPVLIGGIALVLIIIAGGVYLIRMRMQKGKQIKKFKSW